MSYTATMLMAAALAVSTAGTGSDTRLLHTEPSVFAPIVVFEQYGERCMNFDSVKARGRQTCIQLDDPDRMVFEYTRMMTSSLFVHPDPESVLVIGLGGATLPIALHMVLPDAVIDSVEIDPAVVRVARNYFGYTTGPRQRVFVDDGRAYVERAHREGRQYDIVMLDAFSADYIPAHLLTVEFLQLVRDILAQDGIVVANSLTRSTLYERESASYAAVFGPFYNLRASLAGNRVIIAAKGDLPGSAELQHHARKLAKHLEPLGIDAGTALTRFKLLDMHDNNKAEPLRDP